MGNSINTDKYVGIGLRGIIGPSTDANAQAFLAAAGITGATQKTAIDNLVKGLKADGLWSKMKAVYPFVTDIRNLLSYTNAFGNSYYITDGTSSFTANNTTAPDGTNTGTRFTAIASNNNYFYSANTVQGQNFGTGNKAYSIYIKAGTFSGNVSISITSDGTQQSTVATLTNDWQRINVSKNVAVAGNAAQYYIDLAGLSMTSGQFFYIWGAQFETSSTATTYQPIATTQQAYIASQFKYNLKDPRDLDAAFRLVFNGGWTHSSTGATPNGTNGYADTKLVPSSVLSQNSTHISSYIRNTSQGVLLGTDNLFRLWIAPNFNGTQKYVEINSGITTTPSTTISTATGLWLGSRIVSSESKLYNSSSLNYTAVRASSGLDNLSMFISARNTITPSNYSSSQVAFSSLGDGLTDTEAANLYTRVQAFQNQLFRAV